MQEAARRLGVKDDAVRKRIQRGTLQHDKGLDGRVYVYLDVHHEHASGDGGRVGADAVTQDTLLETLWEQIAFLRGELERKDTIIMALTSRIPELEASREPQRSPESATEEPEKGRATSTRGEGAPESPLWRRMFSG